MKKVAVIYKGKYGSTEKYAKWIAEDTGADLFTPEQCRADQLTSYDVIVFGGAVHAGGISGIDFLKKNIKKLEGKKVLVFAVGLSLDKEETREELVNINLVKKLQGIPCYCFPGAYDPEKVKGMDKALMKVVKKMISGGDDDGSNEKLLHAIEEGADYTDRTAIKEIVDEIEK